MSAFSRFFQSFGARASGLCLIAAALCLTTSCNRSSSIVVIEDQTQSEYATETVEQQFNVPLDVAAQQVARRPVFDDKGVSVDLSDCGAFDGFTDEELARLPKIKVVRGAGPISVETLLAFTGRNELVEFLWIDAQLPDSADARSAFKTLAGAPKLKKMRLAGLKLEDGSFPDYVLPALASTPNLVELDISGSAVNADALAAVDYNAGFLKLTKLNLYQTQSGDNLLKAIAPLADRLTSLNLDDTQLSPESAPALEEFSNLTFLHAGRSTLDDQCVESLAKLTKLEEIHVTRTNMTESGADKLRAALPNCNVVSQPEN
ncbi:MAG: hypothetical protein ACOX0A_08235 [Thermoguttaceae bacterium]|jgi:hypothetical protein